MSNLHDIRFTFSTPADATIAFDVVAFEFTEGVSELYRLDIELVSASADADFATLLDQPAALTIWQQEQPVRHKRFFQSALKAPLTTAAPSKELPLPTARTNQHG